MAHIIFPKRWTGKPTLGSQINRGHPLAHHLVSFWAFNESGGLAAKDSAGINDGVISASVPWVGGKNGSALSFDAVDTHNVQIADTGTLAFTDKVTIAALVRPTATVSTYGIFEKTIGGVTDTAYSLIQVSNTFAFRILQTTFIRVVTSPAIVSDAWFSLVATYDGANLLIYANGILQATSARTGAFDSGAGISLIGERGSALSPFQGRIENVGVWHGALSAADIAWLAIEPYAMFLPQAPRVRYFIAPAAGIYTDLSPGNGASGSGFQPANVAF